MDVTKTVRSIEELTPDAQKACNLFIKHCKEAGLNVLITETYRSQERQEYLYAQGRTRLGNVVTWTKNSRHTSRRAWDICKNVKGEEYSDSNFFKECGAIAQKLGITWGGCWKIPDTPHFEIDENRQLPEEVDEMAETENLKKEISELKKRIQVLENKMVYNYIDKNLPSWALETVKKLVESKALVGNENNELMLNDDMLRILVMIDRMGAFDSK